jgi:hypothetical protein
MSLGYVLCLFAGAQPLSAIAAEIYDVEVVIFRHAAAGDNGEQWSRPVGDNTRATGFFPENQFTELAASRYQLNAISHSLQKSGSYSVLFHRAWRQLAYDRTHAVDYPVHSLVVDNEYSVEGRIRLVRERYLHLDVDLQLMSARGNSAILYSDGPGSVPVFELSEKRRIRSNVVHYFDHPRFGMIARVTPYTPPQPAAAVDEPAEPEPVETTEPDMSSPADDDQLTR